jgi:transposase
MSSVTHPGPIHLGLDVHKDSISVAVLPWEQESAEVDKIFHDEPSVRRLIARFPDPGQLRACYEAGPTGYELQRLLARLRVRCDVVAPSLIPRAPGDRVKTDRRDARRLARLHRAGELVAIRVPSEAEEAVRDLCRARADLVDDRRRARQRLGKFGLRHGRIYRDGTAWTIGHERWLAAQSFAEPALAATYARYRAAVTARDAELAGIEADLAVWYDRDPFAAQVARLAAYRGVDRLGALTLASEVCDWRRFPRATAFMGFTGLVPSEYSSGGSVHRGHVTKAGNAHLRTQLIESAWAYRTQAGIGAGLRARHQQVPAETLARSWTAQQRLCGRFHRMAERKNVKTVVATAVARELAGFLWAEMTA